MNISKFKNRQEIRRVVITSFKKRRIRTLGSFMSYLWNGRQRDVVPKRVMTSLTCRTHVLLIKPVNCLLWRSLCLTKVPKNVMACRTHVFLIKQIACLFVCFLTFSSCCTFARVVTMVASLQCCRWGEGYVVQRVFSPNREPNISLISVIFFQSFEREYIQKFWKLMKLAFPIKKFVKYFVHEVHILNFTKRL